MSIAFPANLKNRQNCAESIFSMLQSLPGPVTFHVYDGQPATTLIQPDEFETVANEVATCSIVYVLDGIRQIQEPIAGFVGNESLGTVNLVHLIDDRPPTGDGSIPRRTMGMLGVFIRYLYSDFDWVQRVTVPARVEVPSEYLKLKVTGDEVACITLIDAKHRPKSSRPLDG